MSNCFRDVLTDDDDEFYVVTAADTTDNGAQSHAIMADSSIVCSSDQLDTKQPEMVHLLPNSSPHPSDQRSIQSESSCLEQAIPMAEMSTEHCSPITSPSFLAHPTTASTERDPYASSDESSEREEWSVIMHDLNAVLQRIIRKLRNDEQLEHFVQSSVHAIRIGITELVRLMTSMIHSFNDNVRDEHRPRRPDRRNRSNRFSEYHEHHQTQVPVSFPEQQVSVTSVPSDSSLPSSISQTATDVRCEEIRLPGALGSIHVSIPQDVMDRLQDQLRGIRMAFQQAVSEQSANHTSDVSIIGTYSQSSSSNMENPPSTQSCHQEPPSDDMSRHPEQPESDPMAASFYREFQAMLESRHQTDSTENHNAHGTIHE